MTRNFLTCYSRTYSSSMLKFYVFYLKTSFYLDHIVGKEKALRLAFLQSWNIRLRTIGVSNSCSPAWHWFCSCAHNQSRMCHCRSNDTLCRQFHYCIFFPRNNHVAFGRGGSHLCHNYFIIILTATSTCSINVLNRPFTALRGRFPPHPYGFYVDVHLTVFLSLLPRKEG